MTAIVKAATTTIRNFFYVNPNVPTSISTAYITATTTDGKTTYTYTNSRGEATTINAEKFKGYWTGTTTGGKGYFTETPDVRREMFNADGTRKAAIRVKGEARPADARAPKLPNF